MFRNSHAYIVAQSDMALFDGMVLASFVTQVRGIMFYDFGCLGLAMGKVLSSLGDQTTLLLRCEACAGSYLLGHLEAPMGTRLSSMM